MARLEHHVDAADKERATHTNTEVHDMGREGRSGSPHGYIRRIGCGICDEHKG